jgi:hypothetical protein
MLGMELNVQKAKVMRLSRQPFPIQITTDQKQWDNAEYFIYLGNMITNDARCTSEVKFKIAMAKQCSARRRLYSPAYLT